MLSWLDNVINGDPELCEYDFYCDSGSLQDWITKMASGMNLKHIPQKKPLQKRKIEPNLGEVMLGNNIKVGANVVNLKNGDDREDFQFMIVSVTSYDKETLQRLSSISKDVFVVLAVLFSATEFEQKDMLSKIEAVAFSWNPLMCCKKSRKEMNEEDFRELLMTIGSTIMMYELQVAGY